MYIMILLLLCTITSGVIVATESFVKPYYNLDEAEELFEDFIKTYSKTYLRETEKQSRFNVFRDNLNIINEMNAKGDAVFAINKFADLTKEEFIRDYTGFRPSLNPQPYCKHVTDANITTKDAPASLNWVEKQKVTPVKDQVSCGSCWAFATIGNIESQYAIKTNNLKTFSEQELVDCSKSNAGCIGGNVELAMMDLITLGGLQSDFTYPYEHRDLTCSLEKDKIEVKLNGCIGYDLEDEDKLKEVLAKNGPVAIGIDSRHLMNYFRGILTVKECPADLVMHAVLLVGYGTDNGTDYWLIKNSWSKFWGEHGYFRITRGSNTCGIMNEYSSSAVL